MNQTLQCRVDGETVSIRPIKDTDLELEQDFIRRLSPATKHYRFLGGVRELAPKELKRLCQIDGKTAMAFVATVHRCHPPGSPACSTTAICRRQVR